MKNRFFSPVKSNGFEGQFKSLNDSEMINLRGGGDTEPPLPPPSGEDFPIDLLKGGYTSTLLSVQLVPTVTTAPVKQTKPVKIKK